MLPVREYLQQGLRSEPASKLLSRGYPLRISLMPHIRCREHLRPSPFN